MKPINADGLMALRNAGKRPAGLLPINIGNYRSFPGELTITPDMPVDRLDLRCVIGLDVQLFAESWGNREAAIYGRLREYADEILVTIVDFGDDVGWWWVKRWPENDGRINFADRHYFTRYESARATCSGAKTPQAYADLRKVEAESYAQLLGA